MQELGTGRMVQNRVGTVRRWYKIIPSISYKMSGDHQEGFVLFPLLTEIYFSNKTGHGCIGARPVRALSALSQRPHG